MDNSPLQNPSSDQAAASAPPPVNDSPSVNLEVPEDAPNPLSPFSIMKNRTQVSTGSPLEEPPVEPSLSREQLIEQAAKAPTSPFILPIASVATPVVPAPAPVQVMPVQSQPLQPVLSSPPTPVVPLPQPITPQPTMAPPIPRRPAQLPPPALNVPSKPTGFTPMKRPSKKPVGLIAAIGLLIALVLLAGGGYVLALNGAKIPFLSSLATGLPATGTATAIKALANLTAKDSYQQSGTTSINAQSSDGSPVLSSDTTSGLVNSIKTDIISNAPLLYSLKDKTVVGKEQLTFEDISPLPLYVNTTASGDDPIWLFNLPLNLSEHVVSTHAKDLKKTLLYPSIQPISLVDILNAVKTEKSYQKITGKNISQYSYVFNPDSLKDSLPEGATFSEVHGTISYIWKSVLPFSSTVDGIISYQNRTYHFIQTAEYDKWNTPLENSDEDLAKVNNSEVAQPAPTEIQAFIPQLGIDLSRVPSSLAGSGNSSSSFPITPSGDSIKQLSTTVTTIPSMPVSPAPKEAVSRDVQRQADLSDIQKALQGYKQRQGQYPKSNDLEQIQSSDMIFKALVGDYLTAMPVDPLKQTYWYEYKSDGSTYVLRSVSENGTNAKAKLGKAFYYFEVSGN